MRNSFHDLTFEELVAKREELRRKYLDVRMSHVVGHVENPLEKRTLRRQVARLNTLIYNHPDVQVNEGE
ncbi:50S ribosomal protein L29 [Alkalispirochaeta sphaeroplastigenens]|uniref:Large ribosomal subunit protein uL29 n=1 Tax=Alkalispirochaeta sphaeroplastigenens TaxID=1187066 RepID=A0A2S4JH11_9SPIO|nr:MULTISPECIES: 50S ribosomal protein L29 [Alkalispirochaeta]POQ98765.1 50S ribosomal protein L29 [Alkalispirochaeta sphaeroplastigenens]